MRLNDGGKKRGIKIALTGLLVTVIVATSGVGCVGQISEQASAESENPFITDRVVTVIIIMDEQDWDNCKQNAMAEQYVKADFWFDGELIPDVAVRPKGNSSLWEVASSGSPRLSLKIDFNFFNAARNFYGLKKLNLNNGYSDPTLMREFISYELFGQIGIPTPRASFVDLWVNDEHLGLYTQVEPIDKTFLRLHFPNDFEGNLYKPEMPAASLNWTELELEKQREELAEEEGDDLISNLDVNLGGGKLREILEALELIEPDKSGEPIPGPIVPPWMRPPA
jgi:spore coat protein CotH